MAEMPLNLGSDGNAPSMTVSGPVRAIGGAFQVSPARPAFVCYSVQVALSPGDSAIISIRSDANNPPTTERVRFQIGTDAGVGGDVTYTGIVSALILPGHFVEIRASGSAGASAALITASEWVL